MVVEAHHEIGLRRLLHQYDALRTEITMHVKAGDKVIFSKYAGTEVKVDGEELVIVRQSDILAIVE